MMTIEEFSKINFRVGKVKSVDKNRILIICENKEFSASPGLDVKKGEKIAVIMEGDKIIVPVLNKKIPLAPEKDIELGSRIS